MLDLRRFRLSNDIGVVRAPADQQVCPQEEFVKNYTKSELLSAVADDAGVSKVDAESVLAAFFSTATTAARAGNKVSWAGFGSFSPTHRAARMGRNPRTGEPVQIKASTAMKFSAAKGLKEALNS